MKKIVAVISALMLVLVMAGCSGGTSLNKETSCDGVSWKYSGSWVEEVDEFSDSVTFYSYTNGKDRKTSGYNTYATVCVTTKPYRTPEENVEDLKDMAKTNPNISTCDYTKVSEDARDGAQVVTYEEKETSKDGKESTSYLGFITKPGKVMVEVSCNIDKTTFDAIMNSVSVS